MGLSPLKSVIRFGLPITMTEICLRHSRLYPWLKFLRPNPHGTTETATTFECTGLPSNCWTSIEYFPGALI